jgi:hypothetical protein
VRLAARAALQLGYGLIDGARAVEVNEEREKAFDKGIKQGLADGRRDGAQSRMAKKQPT